MPIVSVTQAIVFAVNNPEQLPAPEHAHFSSSSSSSSVIYGKCEIQFETNGTSKEDPIEEAYYVISPKTDKENVYKRYLQYGNVFFKFVIENQTDIDFVLELLEKYEKPANEVYLQPEFSKAPQVMDLILSNRLPLNVKVTGQLHKYLKQR